MNPLRLICCLALAFLASCAGPGGGGAAGGATRDVWGHRPGPQGFTTVILDAGHGGHDSGARSPHTGDMEKNLTLDTCRRIRQELGSQFRVLMMRDSDTFVDLDDRVVRANSLAPAVLVSVHYNSGPSHVAGPETFYWRVDSYSLAKRIQRELEALAPRQSGNRHLVRRRLRLTRNPEIPGVLVECGYLSSPQESRLAADPGYRQRLARAIANGIRAQAAYGDAGMGPLPGPLYAPPSRPTDAPE